MPETPSSATVVGSGPNGLAAAIELARAGVRAEVFEAAERPGGGCRSAELTLPGFRHDVCSAIHPFAAASPFLRELPLHEHGLLWLQPPAPLAHPFDDGSAVLLARSVDDTAENLGPADARRYRRIIAPLARNIDALAGAILRPLHIPRHPLVLARYGPRGIRSVQHLARTFDGERARALLGGMAAHSMLRLDQSPTAGVALLFAAVGHALGWPAPQGGADAIPAALTSYLTGLGGTVTTGRRIESFGEVDDGVVLLDVTPRQVLELAREQLPQRYVRRLQRYRYGPGVFKVDWALDAPIPWLAEDCARAGTLHLGGTLEEIAASERAAWNGDDGDRPFVLLAQQSPFDETRAPAGKHTPWAYCHVPHGSAADMTARIEAQVERFAPGFRDLILARSARGPRELQSHNANLVGGDISGGANTLDQLFFRPTFRRVPYAIPAGGLYICSSSTPPGGGVHGMCGYHAAHAALEAAF